MGKAVALGRTPRALRAGHARAGRGEKGERPPFSLCARIGGGDRSNGLRQTIGTAAAAMLALTIGAGGDLYGPGQTKGTAAAAWFPN